MSERQNLWPVYDGTESARLRWEVGTVPRESDTEGTVPARLDEEEAMKRMKAYRLADQVLFHTEKALQGLRYLTTVEVPR